MQRPPSTLRRSLRLVVVAWVFGAAWLYLTTGAAFTRFSQLMGMTKFGFGLLAAMPFVGALFQLPVSYFIGRFGHRKTVFITAGIIHRLLWLPLALLPWLLPAGWRWQGVIVIFGLSWIAGHMPGPAWVSWMADLVPAPIRGRYFSRRSQVGQFVGVVVTIFIGFLLDRAQLAGQATLLRMATAALAVAAVCGVSDFLFFLPVPDVRRAQPDPQLRIGELLREPLRDRNFRRFLGYTATLTFAVGFVPQFAWLYIFDVARMTNTQANAMLVVMPLLVLMTTVPVWGRLLDRLGRKPVLILAGLLIVPGAAAWIFVTRQHWVAGYLAVIVATAAWPGVELGIFNVLLSMSDAPGRRAGTAHVAINSAVNAVAGILSGLFGGAVAEALGNWQTTVCGWPLTYHGVLFTISSALRLVAVGWLFNLVETGTHTPRTALRYLGTNIYSNLQQAVFIPGRLLQQLGRWTYQITPARPWWRRGRRP